MCNYSVSGYISSITDSVSKDPQFDKSLLDTLQHFAWSKYVSSYQIYSNIQGTAWKMAYKNVHKRVNALLSAGLIQKTEIDDTHSNRHKAKYYKLTEYGIYRLFLYRVNFIIVNQSDVRKHRALEPYRSFNTLTFFRNYSDSMLFEVFLYPYFTKETLIAIGDSRFLIDLYRYLTRCCEEVEKYLNSKESGGAMIFSPIFSWDNIPGRDNQKLLAHLKEKFNLEKIQPVDIKKEDIEHGSKIILTISGEAPVIITLDNATNRVEIISREVNQSQYKKLEYDIYLLNGEKVVGNKIDTNDSAKHIIENTRRMMEELIYGFVYDLASLSTAENPEISYYVQILSADNRFMHTLKEIYENRHKVFESGYNMLTHTH